MDELFPKAGSSSSAAVSSSSTESSSSSSFAQSSGCTASDNDDTQYCSNGIIKQYGFIYFNSQRYKTVEIGSQTWMAENLNYDNMNKKCYYDQQDNCEVFGGLYTWEYASHACIEFGDKWYLPTEAEWETLKKYIETEKKCENCAEKYLKAIDNWDNGDGTDDYGFAALPGGYYSYNNFNDVDFTGYWWSLNSFWDKPLVYELNSDTSKISDLYDTDKYFFFSIRCIKGD
jgi:uncharacterized protein (TIGR02145 family)